MEAIIDFLMENWGTGGVGLSLFLLYVQGRRSNKKIESVNQSVNCKKPEDPTIYEAMMEVRTDIKLLAKDVEYIADEVHEFKEDFKEHKREDVENFKAINDKLASRFIRHYHRHFSKIEASFLFHSRSENFLKQTP